MKDRTFLTLLALSLLLHGLMFFLIMTAELPPPPSREEYTDWVKKIATDHRKATVAPLVQNEEVYKPSNMNQEEAPSGKNATASGGGSGGARKGAQAGSPGGGASGGSVRRQVSGAGVLGVIGVASEGSGGEFADVFSSSAKGVSEDLGKVMSGKRGAGFAGAGSDLSREGFGKGEGGSGVGGVADIGSGGTGAKGSVEGGSRKEASLRIPQVGSGDADILSGNIDRKSVSSVMSRKSSSFRRCYERALKANPNLHGKLAFELTIDPTGRVVDVRFIEDMLKSSDVNECIKSILMRLVFPDSGGKMATFRSSLVFEAQ